MMLRALAMVFPIWPVGHTTGETWNIFNGRVTVAPADFSNNILGRTKFTLLTPNCLASFNPSIAKDCPRRQISRDIGINKTRPKRALDAEGKPYFKY